MAGAGSPPGRAPFPARGSWRSYNHKAGTSPQRPEPIRCPGDGSRRTRTGGRDTDRFGGTAAPGRGRAHALYGSDGFENRATGPSLDVAGRSWAVAEGGTGIPGYGCF